MKTQEAKTTTPKKPTKAKAPKGAGKAAPKKAAAKTPKATKTTKAKPKAKNSARAGSKTAIVRELLRRKEGATLEEIAKATAWQNHSIRGFISGQVTKKMGLKVESTKSEAGERTYRIA
jgi:hypothetical protein